MPTYEMGMYILRNAYKPPTLEYVRECIPASGSSSLSLSLGKDGRRASG